MLDTQEKPTKQELRQRINSFIEQSNLDPIKEKLSQVKTFSEIVKNIKQSFDKSIYQKHAFERAKEIISEENNLLTLLEWREVCIEFKKLATVQSVIETQWENVWTSNIKNNETQDNLFFLEKIENFAYLPHFASSCIRRETNYI